MQILPVQYSSGVLSITGQRGSMECNHTFFIISKINIVVGNILTIWSMLGAEWL